jgi:hypothetical protein
MDEVYDAELRAKLEARRGETTSAAEADSMASHGGPSWFGRLTRYWQA